MINQYRFIINPLTGIKVKSISNICKDVILTNKAKIQKYLR